MSWRTSLFGLLAAIGAAIVAVYQLSPELLKELPAWIKGVAALMTAIGTAGMGFMARDNKVTSEDVAAQARKRAESNGTWTAPLLVMLLLAVLTSGLLIWCTGCTSFHVRQTETMIGTNAVRVTDTRIRTFWDARNELSKFRTTFTDKSQSQSVGALGQESSGSNAVTLAEGVTAAAIGAALKAAK